MIYKTFSPLLLWLLLVISAFTANASHILGSKMWNEHLSGCTYRVYLEVYSDCSFCNLNGGVNPAILNHPYFQPITPPFGFPSTLTPNNFQVTTIPASCGGQPVFLTTNPSFLYYYELTPVCATATTLCMGVSSSVVNGVVAIVYYYDVSLCGLSCQQVTFAWSDCCRNVAEVSIVNPSTVGYYKSTTIDLTYPTNHAATVPDETPFYVSDNTSSVFNIGAYDIDGDSLSYELDTAKTSTATPATYNSGFSPTQPLGPNWSVGLNANTGRLSFTPSPGGSIGGCAALNIAVKEWRNGIHINTVNYEQMVCPIPNITNNATPHIAYTLQVQNGAQVNDSTFFTYPNQNFSFKVFSSDNNISDTLDLWCDLPNAALLHTGANPLTSTINWTPTLADTGVHYFHLKVLDDVCPLRGYSNRVYKITVPNAYVTDTIVHAACGFANGSIDINPVNFVPPLTYSWSNGITTQDLNNVMAGTYQITMTDGVGNVFQQSYTISNTNMQGNILNGPISCFGTTGVMLASASGGTAPYTYSWNTGLVGNMLMNTVPNGVYGVYITDAIGCLLHLVAQQTKEDSCYNIIKGVAYHDVNGNCVQDVGETGIANSFIHLNQFQCMFTNSNGEYEFWNNLATTQYVTYIPFIPYRVIDCPTAYTDTVVFTQNFGELADSNDFPIKIYPVKDLKVNLLVSNYIPGFPFHAEIHYENQGTLPVSGVSVTYQYPNILNSLTYLPSPSTINGGTQTITWNLGTLAAGASGVIHVNGMTNVTAVLGASVTSIANILPLVGDTLTYNNTAIDNKLVVGSYDPNDKQVSPRGNGAAGNITLNDSILTYTIRFQNTGNYPATYVTLRDTLDNDLEISSIQLIGMSHEATVSIENGNVLVFRFVNIGLAASSVNEPASHGYVWYSIHTKNNLPLGTEIRNRAAIYFDYNAPIITNETLNTLYSPTALEDADFANAVKLIPNPTTTFSTLSFPNEQNHVYELYITDLTGRFIQKISSRQNEILLDASTFSEGVYLLHLQGKHQYRGKWVVK